MNKKLGTGEYYNLVQSYQHNRNIPKSGIYSYSFSIFPEELQPSGSLNMSRIDTAILSVSSSKNEPSLFVAHR